MSMLLLISWQIVAAAPDIQLNASIRAKAVTIEKEGRAALSVTSSPRGDNLVDVQAPKRIGRNKLRNVDVKVRAEARVANPLEAVTQNSNIKETSPQK